MPEEVEKFCQYLTQLDKRCDFEIGSVQMLNPDGNIVKLGWTPSKMFGYHPSAKVKVMTVPDGIQVEFDPRGAGPKDTFALWIAWR